jgi:hypothetical protein
MTIAYQDSVKEQIERSEEKLRVEMKALYDKGWRDCMKYYWEKEVEYLEDTRWR